MKCNEVRNLVLPYLNSELDARTTQTIELHVQGCAECAELFENEGKFDEWLTRVLRSEAATPRFWAQLEARLRPAPGLGWFTQWWRRRAVAALAACALAVLAVAGALFLPSLGSLDLAAALEPDHAKYVAGALEAQFQDQPSARILAQTHGRLDANAFSRLPTGPAFRPAGKRLCHLGDVPVAWILGRQGQLPVSIVVLRRTELDQFPQLRRRLEAGHPVVCARAGRYRFAARAVGDHVVCAMSAMSRDQLEELVKTVPVAGNAG